MKQEFWSVLERLVAESNLVIDRPKGTTHWRYPDYVYPMDYGYLEGTSSMDGDGIDVWIGTVGQGCDLHCRSCKAGLRN